MTLLQRVSYKFPKANRYYQTTKHLLFSNDSYLRKTGWYKSLQQGRPVDAAGAPLPWMCYPAIDFLAEHLRPEHTLFEFGSGYSTIFYANRVRHVTSLEYDKKWLDKITAEIPRNVQLVYQEKDVDGEYCRAINKAGGNFDVVIIDGRDRVNCFKQSLGQLTETGVIFLDDTMRERYQEALMLGKEQGFKLLHFQGIKPTGYITNRTTLFYKTNNCLGL